MLFRSVHSFSPLEHRSIVAVLADAGFGPRRITRITLTESIFAAVRAENAIGIMPRWTVQRAASGPELRAVALGGGGMFRKWQAVTRTTSTPSVQAQAFATEVSRLMEPIVSSVGKHDESGRRHVGSKSK